MTDNEFNRTARAWLADGPNRISDRALLSALDEVHRTRQRPRLVAGAEAITNVHPFPSRRGGRSDHAHRRRCESPSGGGVGRPDRPPTPTPTPIAMGAGDPASLDPGTYATPDPFRATVTFTVPAEWQGTWAVPIT